MLVPRELQLHLDVPVRAPGGPSPRGHESPERPCPVGANDPGLFTFRGREYDGSFGVRAHQEGRRVREHAEGHRGHLRLQLPSQGPEVTNDVGRVVQMSLQGGANVAELSAFLEEVKVGGYGRELIVEGMAQSHDRTLGGRYGQVGPKIQFGLHGAGDTRWTL